MDLNAFAQYLVKNNILSKEHMQECLNTSQLEKEAFFNILKRNFYFSEERLNRYISDFQELQKMFEEQKKSAEFGDISKDTSLLQEMEKFSSEATLVPFQEAPKTLLDPLMQSFFKAKKQNSNSSELNENIIDIQPLLKPSKKIKSQSALFASFSESLQTPKKSESSRSLKSFSENIASKNTSKPLSNEIPNVVSDQELLREIENLSPKSSTEQITKTNSPKENENDDLLQEMEQLRQNQQSPAEIQKKHPVPLDAIHDKTIISVSSKENKNSHPPTQKQYEQASDHFIQNRYNILEVLGTGGMGVVQRVKDKFLGREVALKRIKMAPEGFQQLSRIQQLMLWRLSREAEITANLEHPNIVPVYDMQQQSNGEIYFTMRKVEGETLRAIFSKNRQYPEKNDPLKLLSIFLKVCDAISYAHSRNIIHRDLKPENIMVGAYGNVYVMDWGIAKQLEDISHSTIISASFASVETNNYQTIGGIGTPGYMPPEQEKNANQVLPQSDVYALGVILRQCFTLISPEEEFKLQISIDQQKLKSKNTSKEFTTDNLPIEKIVPSDIQAIYLKATEEYWENRYETVEELAADVRQYLQHGRVSVKRYNLFELFLKWGNRNRKGIFFLLTLGVLAFILYSYLLENTDLKKENLETKSKEKENEKRVFQEIKNKKQKQEEKIEETNYKMTLLQKLLEELPTDNKQLTTTPKKETENSDTNSNDLKEEGKFHLEQRNFNKAVEIFTMAIEKDDKDAELYYLRAKALREKSDFLKAIENCNLAIEYKLDYGEAYLLRDECKKEAKLPTHNRPKYPKYPKAKN